MADGKKKDLKAAQTEKLMDEIVQRVVRLVADIRKRQSAMVQNYGVTMLQYTAIQILKDSGPINITRLAKKLHLNQSTVSSLVDRMERDNLVRRVQSSEDRRSVKLRLTDKAYDVTVDLPIAPFDFFKGLLTHLSSEEQQSLARMMLKLDAAFQKQLAEIDAQQARLSGKKAQGSA